MSSSPAPSGQIPTRISSDVKSTLRFIDLIEKRSLGLKRYQFIHDDLVAVKLYSNFYHYEINKLENAPQVGGIFNLEFSVDGKLLIAACEGKQILLFDSANQQLLKTVENAHENCVNCVKFLNDKHFATCSDDTSIKIWDIRKMQTCMRTLHGHSNWVKNIEWTEKDNVMVTSAFDGSIYSWNLTPNDSNMLYDKVFLMNGLMRMKLTNDGNKMVISTTSGYIIIIHDLNLMNLATDLRSFRPDLYRLMQTSEQCFPAGTISNCLFSPTRKRNRIEFIEDFPNEAEVISSLQIHPRSTSIVSRNINGGEDEEWTAVHDLHPRDSKEYEDAFMYIEEEVSEQVDPEEQNNHRPTDLWMAYISLEEYNNHNRDFTQAQDNMWENFQIPTMGILNSGLIGLNSSYSAYFRQHPEHQNKIIRNLPRMRYFIKEKSVGKGYIKELCFSSDGRIIGSPHGKGVRLLAFGDTCEEMTAPFSVKADELKPLIELNDYHKDVVVCSKFSPTHYQLVTGCLGSEIKWFQPVI